MSEKWFPFCLGPNVFSREGHKYSLRGPDRTRKVTLAYYNVIISPPIVMYSTVI